jgi:hypothetical protein
LEWLRAIACSRSCLPRIEVDGISRASQAPTSRDVRAAWRVLPRSRPTGQRRRGFLRCQLHPPVSTCFWRVRDNIPDCQFWPACCLRPPWLPHSVRYRTANAQITASFHEFFSRCVTKTRRGKVPSPFGGHSAVGTGLTRCGECGFQWRCEYGAPPSRNHKVWA